MAITPITSPQNAKLKALRGLFSRHGQSKTDQFVLEGMRHNQEAMAAGWTPVFMVVTDEKKAPTNAEALLIDVTLMSRISGRKNAPDVVGVYQQRWQGLPATDDFVLALENIRDPGNLGTIIRTAAACGVGHIALIEQSCNPYSLEAIRASMGTFRLVSFSQSSADMFASWLKARGGTSVATHLQATHHWQDVPQKQPLTLVMGSESTGLSDKLTDSCTSKVRIPMAAGVESLNVAMATGLMLYELTGTGKL